MAREPWERANIERFRHALVLMGEPDPDGLIAQRLSGQVPFTSTDLSLGGDPLPVSPPKSAAASPPPPPSAASPAQRAAQLAPPVEEAEAPPAAKPSKKKKRDQFELGTNAVDIESILGELDSPTPTARARTESVEVDLSIVLDDIRKPAPSSSAPAPKPGAPAADLDGCLTASGRRVRRRRSGRRRGAQGLAFYSAGRIDEAIPRAGGLPRPGSGLHASFRRIFRERGITSGEWSSARRRRRRRSRGGHQLLPTWLMRWNRPAKSRAH